MRKLNFSDESEEDALQELEDLADSLETTSPEAGGSIREKSTARTTLTKLKKPVAISKKDQK